MTTIIISLVTALISAIVALVVARHNSKLSEDKLRTELEQAESRLKREFAIQTSLEQVINKLMSKGFALRSFSLIKHHLRGFNDDELRKLLISSGCICFKVIKSKEYWGLLEENESLLKDRKSMAQKGMNFYDISDDDIIEDHPDASSA